MKAFRSPNGWAVELLEAEAAIKAAVLAEREACAKVCDKYASVAGGVGSEYGIGFINGASGCAAAIRARGEK